MITKRSFIAVLLSLVILSLSSSTVFAQKPAPKAPPIVIAVTTYPDAQRLADEAAYNAAMAAKDYDGAQAIRDSIVWRIISGIDFANAEWKNGLINGNSKKNFYLDIVESGALAGISLFTPVGTKNALAAAVEFVRGGRASYNKEFLNSHTLSAVLNAMEAGRTNQRTIIENGLSVGPLEYSLAQAEADAIVYFYKGSLTAGIEALGEQSAAGLQAARANAVGARTARTTAAPRKVKN